MDIYGDVFYLEDLILDFEKSVRSFNKALKASKRELKDTIDRKLAMELAVYKLSDSAYATAGIVTKYTPLGIVVMFPDKWLYIEFGTGLKGSQSPHPSPSFTGAFQNHNVGKHSSNPVSYGGLGRFPYPKKDGTWGVSSGQPAHPVAYKTWVYGQKMIKQIYIKNLRRFGF